MRITIEYNGNYKLKSKMSGYTDIKILSETISGNYFNDQKMADH